MGPTALRTVVYATLLLLLGINIGLTVLPLSDYRIAAHLAIAVTMALLVFLVFMRLHDSPALIQVMASGTLLWVLILFGFVFLDYTHR